MNKSAAVFLLIVVVAMLTYSTVHLFWGNFAKAFAPFPLLILYYVFFLARRKSKTGYDDEDESRPAPR